MIEGYPHNLELPTPGRAGPSYTPARVTDDIIQPLMTGRDGHSEAPLARHNAVR